MNKVALTIRKLDQKDLSGWETLYKKYLAYYKTELIANLIKTQLFENLYLTIQKRSQTPGN